MTITDNVLFIDIETVSQSEGLSGLNERWVALFERKIRYLHEREPEKTFDQLYKEKAAIFSEFGKIICICVGRVQDESLKMKSFGHADEKELLTAFFDWFGQRYKDPQRQKLCGHNIREFDLPYICRRAIIHGMELPGMFQVGDRKPWELRHIVDTLDLWKFGDQKNYISLDLLAACLGLDSPKSDLDGSKVGAVYYESGDVRRIARYCANDVWVTTNVFRKLNAMPPVPFDESQYAFVDA